MEDKIFELMTKMYGEMQQGFSNMNNRLEKLESKVDSIDERLMKVENKVTVMEDENKLRFNALFDGYKHNTEVLYGLETDIKNLTKVVNNHEVKLTIVK